MLHREKNRPLSAVSNDVARSIRVGSSVAPAPLSAGAAQRLSILGEMTGGIVHDFRNTLSVIDSALRLAESNLSNPDKAATFISGAREGIARGVRLTSRLLNLARQGDIKTGAADANSLLKNLEVFLKYGAGPSVRIVLECSPTLWPIVVDPSQFAAAMLNLVVNARDAMASAGGEVRISTSHVQPTSATVTSERHGAYVRVRVQDNGSGISDHIAQRLFEPFFTTKGDNGTGLGLPQVGAFMRQIGGHVNISSEEGRGTTVDLFFPGIEPGAPLPGENHVGIDTLSVAEPSEMFGPLSGKIDPKSVSPSAVLS